MPDPDPTPDAFAYVDTDSGSNSIQNLIYGGDFLDPLNADMFCCCPPPIIPCCFNYDPLHNGTATTIQVVVSGFAPKDCINDFPGHSIKITDFAGVNGTFTIPISWADFFPNPHTFVSLAFQIGTFFETQYGSDDCSGDPLFPPLPSQAIISIICLGNLDGLTASLSFTVQAGTGGTGIGSGPLDCPTSSAILTSTSPNEVLTGGAASIAVY